MTLEIIYPDIFDDRARLERAGIDLDIFDSMRGLLAGGVDLDDRAAVERVIIAPDAYRHIPKTFSRFVDACIESAKANKVAGGLKRDATGESGFIVLPKAKR